jgi:hypothetical protein
MDARRSRSGKTTKNAEFLMKKWAFLLHFWLYAIRI